LPLTESGSSCHACITCSFAATCIDIPRCIPLRLMNYKDALNVSINEKLTKAKLIDIANTLQDHCLVSEVEALTLLDKPTLIPLSSYIKDVRSRWGISQRESRALVKDIMNVGKQARAIYDQAYARAFN